MSNSHSTNYSSAGVKGEDVPPSPCAQAYDEMSRSQRHTEDLLEQLETRLSPILSDRVPSIGQNQGQATANPVQSEVHGWLAAGANRATVQNGRLMDLLGRLTV